LWRVAQRDHSRALFWVGFILLVMPQFHLSGLLLIPTAGLVLWLSRRPLNLRWLAFGVVLGLLLYAPYLSGEIGNHWQNTRAMTANGPPRYTPDTLKAFVAPASYLLNYWVPKWQYTPAEYDVLLRSAFGSTELAVAARLLSTVVALCVSTGAILIGGRVMWDIWRSPRGAFDRWPGRTFLVVGLVCPLASAILLGQPFPLRHLLVVLAPLYGLFGAAAVMWLGNKRVRWSFAVLLLIAIGTRLFFLPRLSECQWEMSQTTTRFIPSFHNLEQVYQDLTVHAGRQRLIEIRDQDYHRSLTSEESEWLGGAELIRRYVNVRNKSLGVALGRGTSPAIYELRRESDVKVADPNLAYLGNGIAIVSAP
jgi:hypothetical protein